MASTNKTKIDSIVDADSYFSLLIHLLFTAIWDYNICSVWILLFSHYTWDYPILKVL